MKRDTIEISFILLLICVLAIDGELHSLLYRIIPPQNIYPKEPEITVKGFEAVEKKETTSVITVFETDLKGMSNFGYYMTVGIGSPPQNFNLVIDTGSSNTAVAGYSPQQLSSYFDPTRSSTFINHDVPFKVNYDSGRWSAVLSSDIFTFEGMAFVDRNKTLKYDKPVNVRSNFGVITQSTNFFPTNANYQGIMGLAYPILAQPGNLAPKSTLFDDFVAKYGLPNMFSIVLCGQRRLDGNPVTSGYFIAGGKNDSLYEPPMVDILINRKWFYEIIISRISISDKPIILSSCKEYNRNKAILDTGTTDTYFPSVIFHALVSSIIFNMKKGPFSVTKTSPFWDRRAVICTINGTSQHPALYFPEIQLDLVIDDSSSLELALSPQQYIQYVGDQLDGFGNRRNCYKFGFGQSKSGTILGDSFLEGFYLLFNKETSKVGIAQSKCNIHVPDISRSGIVQIKKNQLGLLACAVRNKYPSSIFSHLTPKIMIFMGILFGLILIPSLVILLYFRCNESSESETRNLLQ